METVKVESFEQSSLTDESMSIVNMHAPSGSGGAGAGVPRLWGGADEGLHEGGSHKGHGKAEDPQITGIE